MKLHPTIARYLEESQVSLATLLTQPGVKAFFDHLSNDLAENDRLEAAFDAFPGHISWVTSDGQYLGVNQRLASSVGLSPGDFFQRPLGFVTQDSPFVRFIKDFLAHDKNEDRQVLELKFSAEGPAVWHSVIAKKYDQGKKAVIIGLDVSELQRVQDLISELQRQVNSVTRLATLGEVAAGMTHEINNPVTVIMGSAYALRDELTTSKIAEPRFTEFLDLIEKAAQHIGLLIEGTRTLAHAEVDPPMTHVRVAAIVADAVALCGEKTKKKQVKLTVEVDPNLELDCRVTEILQVLINLISNACDALEGKTERWIKVAARGCPDDMVQLSVTDSGPGIPAATRAKIFQPFFTTKSADQGTGLGLSIAKTIADRHGGSIFVDGECANTRFVIDLPATPGARCRL